MAFTRTKKARADEGVASWSRAYLRQRPAQEKQARGRDCGDQQAPVRVHEGVALAANDEVRGVETACTGHAHPDAEP